MPVCSNYYKSSELYTQGIRFCYCCLDNANAAQYVCVLSIYRHCEVAETEPRVTRHHPTDEVSGIT